MVVGNPRQIKNLLFVRLTATNFVTHKQKVHFLTYTAILWQIVECKIYTEHGNEDIVQDRSLKNCFVKMQAELFFCFHGVSLQTKGTFSDFTVHFVP